MAPTKAKAKPANASMSAVFDDAQRGFSNHRKNVKLLQEMQRTWTTEAFRTEFVAHVNRILLIFKREPAVERLVEFVSSFATLKNADGEHLNAAEGEEGQSDENNDDFAVFLMRYLLHFADAKDKAVRFRVCQIVGKVLNNLGEDAEIDGELWEGIQTEMARRLKDKIPVVRMQAVNALSRLQEPADADCPIIAEFVRIATKDSSADVRRTVIGHLSLNKITLRVVVGRMRDANEGVRKQAIRVVTEKVAIKALSIADRVEIVRSGLGDRAESVQAQCTALIAKNWLRAVSNNIAELLRCLDVETNESLGEKIVAAVVSSVGDFGYTADHFVRMLSGEGEFGPAEALLWKSLCAYHSGGAQTLVGKKASHPLSEERFEQLAPELSGLCEIIRRTVAEIEGRAATRKDGDNADDDGEEEEEDEEENTLLDIQDAFVARQLLGMAATLDMSDEVGRKNCGRLCVDLLSRTSTPASLVKPLVALIASVHPGEEERMRVVNDTINGIRAAPAPAKAEKAPKEPKVVKETAESRAAQRALDLRIAALRIRALEARDKKEACVAKDDFQGASEAKEELDAILKEQAALIKLQEEPDVEVSDDDDEEDAHSPPAVVYLDTPEINVRCLLVASALFEGLTIRGPASKASNASTATAQRQATVRSLVDSLVLPSIQTEDADVRNCAMECLGLACLLDGDFARRHLLLFLQAAQVDQEAVIATALRALFDIALVFGPSLVATGASEGDDDVRQSIVPVLMRYLGNDSPLLRTVATEGFSKLALHGIAASPQLLSHLLILYFNPTTEDDVHLRQCLNVFFPAFAFASRGNQQTVERALLPTVRTFTAAPETSPLATVPAHSVAQFIIYLCGKPPMPTGTAAATASRMSQMGMHDDLAVSLCNEILVDASSQMSKALIKALGSLKLSFEDEENIRGLRVLAEQMLKAVTDKSGLRHVIAFADSLRSDDGRNDAEDDETALAIDDTDEKRAESSVTASAESGIVATTETSDAIASTAAITTESAPKKRVSKPKAESQSQPRAKKPSKKAQTAAAVEEPRVAPVATVSDAIGGDSDDEIIALKKTTKAKATSRRKQRTDDALCQSDDSDGENAIKKSKESATGTCGPAEKQHAVARPSRKAATAAKAALTAIDNLVDDSD